MTNEETNGGAKRLRSPPYPAVNLSDAIDRAEQLYAAAAHHPVGWNVLATAWDYKLGSGSLGAAAAALIQFGLLADEGSGDKRKFTVTDAAIRILRDADPNSEKRREAVQRAALQPKIYLELWEKYGDASSVQDVVLQNYLTFDRKDEGKAPYGFEAAEAVIAEYRATIAFAQLSKSSTVASPHADKGATGGQHVDPLLPPKPPPPSVKVGDFVQWSSKGVDQFQVAKRVESLSADGQFAFVLGSPTGLPMNELTATDAPGRSKPADATPSRAGADENPIEVFMTSTGRLQVSANVDAEGLKTLRDVLDKYGGILELLSRKVGTAKKPDPT